ncbi:MAG TPA: hypothetical protein PKZ76_14100 [Xanthomonadaceae bacterium]|nr:hypothetical protein [Xanthomonadaceae bacterium]
MDKHNPDTRRDDDAPVRDSLEMSLAEPESVRRQADAHDARVEAALRNHAGTWLARLLPDRIGREVKEHELAELQAGFDYRRRALQMAIETKLQAVEEMCNHVLVTGKSEVRRRRQEVFAEQRLMLQQSLDKLADRFGADMERRFEAVANIRSEVLRCHEERRLERAVEEFHGTLDRLAEDFVAIIREGVQR